MDSPFQLSFFCFSIYPILIVCSLFRWVKIPGTELLPGDIVSIGRSTSGEDRSVPADMLLLAGSAIVNEAILTGESTPQWKVFFCFPLDILKK
jgi:P-type E1-E2 ATPase